MSLRLRLANLAMLFAGGADLNANRGTEDDLPHMLDDLADRSTKLSKLVDAQASDATAETVMYTNAGDHTQDVTGVSFTPGATLTANDTSYATITVKKRTAAGVDAGTVASVTTKTASGGGTGDWSAFVPVALTLSTDTSLTSLGSGESLTLSIAKASSGVVVPAGVFNAKWK